MSGRIEVAGRYPRSAQSSLLPLAIIANKEIGPGAKLLYSKLLDYAQRGETATNNRLAPDLSVSPRSVRNYMAELKSARLVEVHRHPGKPNSYRLPAAV
jgi:hypothetical protein